MPGWCNGVAGHLLMWTRLWQCSGQSDDREVMERIAWGVMESRTVMGNVCCGAAGQAVALASFASATKDASWQKRARDFLNGLIGQRTIVRKVFTVVSWGCSLRTLNARQMLHDFQFGEQAFNKLGANPDLPRRCHYVWQFGADLKTPQSGATH